MITKTIVPCGSETKQAREAVKWETKATSSPLAAQNLGPCGKCTWKVTPCLYCFYQLYEHCNVLAALHKLSVAFQMRRRVRVERRWWPGAWWIWCSWNGRGCWTWCSYYGKRMGRVIAVCSNSSNCSLLFPALLPVCSTHPVAVTRLPSDGQPFARRPLAKFSKTSPT